MQHDVRSAATLYLPTPFYPMPMRPLLLTALLAVPVLASAQDSPDLPPPQVVSMPETQTGVSLTVYNAGGQPRPMPYYRGSMPQQMPGGFAVVRERRPVPLQRGDNRVRFEGVAAQIEPATLALSSRTDPGGVAVAEQNYQYDLIGTESVLDAAVGQRVRLVRRLGEESEVVAGVLISQPGQGRIVRLDDGRVLVDPQGEIELMAMPEGLVSRPSLLWQLAAERAATHDLEVSYLTNGIGWEADYVAVLAADDQTIDLQGWVTLDNQSGATYREAQLQLMAGEVRRVQPDQRQQPMYDMMVQEVAMNRGAAPPEEESFFEYHLYTFDRPTTLRNREQKQLTLLQADAVGVQRRLILDASGQYFPFRQRRPGQGGSSYDLSAAVVVELANSEANNMGMPLPKGTVRLYQADRRGNLQFLGEDRIEHTRQKRGRAPVRRRRLRRGRHAAAARAAQHRRARARDRLGGGGAQPQGNGDRGLCRGAALRRLDGDEAEPGLREAGRHDHRVSRPARARRDPDRPLHRPLPVLACGSSSLDWSARAARRGRRERPAGFPDGRRPHGGRRLRGVARAPRGARDQPHGGAGHDG